MIFLDTNILLRLLLKDEKEQYKKVTRFIEEYKGKFFISDIVVLEVFQVLTGKRLGYSHKRAAFILKEVLTTLHIYSTIEHMQAHFWCCDFLQTTSVDYTDAFLMARATLQNAKIASFDSDIKRSFRIEMN